MRIREGRGRGDGGRGSDREVLCVKQSGVCVRVEGAPQGAAGHHAVILIGMSNGTWRGLGK